MQSTAVEATIGPGPVNSSADTTPTTAVASGPQLVTPPGLLVDLVGPWTVTATFKDGRQVTEIAGFRLGFHYEISIRPDGTGLLARTEDSSICKEVDRDRAVINANATKALITGTMQVLAEVANGVRTIRDCQVTSAPMTGSVLGDEALRLCWKNASGCILLSKF